MMKFLIHQCFLYTCLLLLLSGCGGCNLQNKDPRHEQIENQLVVTPLQSYRLDEMVFNNADKKDFKKQIEQLPEVVFTAYLEQIMGMGKASDSSTWQTLQRFAQFKDMRDLQQASIETHGPEKIKDYEKQLAESFARLKVLLPKEENPNLIWMNAGLAAASFAINNNLFIGLDYYIYPHPLVKEFPPERFPNYKRFNMDARYLCSNALFNWLSFRYDHYDSIPPEKNDFLSSMIYSGKIMYALGIVQPETADSTHLMWSKKEWDWANENELNIWKEIARQDVLFGTQKEEIAKWFNEAPFTNAGNLPAGASPQLGLWMGWKIVSAYMIKNPNVTLEQLWKERNNQKILSAYKPEL
jgi:hypothetical protein